MINVALALLLAVVASAERRPVKRPARPGVTPAAEAPESTPAAASADAPAAPKKDEPASAAKPRMEEPSKKEAPKMEWKGQYGGAPETGHRLITDQKGWDALWRVLGKEAPALDLKAYNVVAVFIGEKPTGGWTATFEEPREKDGDTLVVYRVNAPKGFVTQAFTQPYAVKAFPKPKSGKMLVMEAKPE